jgi:hypothetical protein
MVGYELINEIELFRPRLIEALAIRFRGCFLTDDACMLMLPPQWLAKIGNGAVCWNAIHGSLMEPRLNGDLGISDIIANCDEATLICKKSPDIVRAFQS